MIADGYYKARATGVVSFGFSSKGVDGMSVECDVLGDDDAPITRMMTWFYFTRNNAQMNGERLRALGVVGDDLSVDPIPGLGSVIARCEIKTETYEGKQRQKLEIKTGGGAVFQDEMNPEARRKFAARMRSLMGTIPVAPGASAVRAPAPARPTQNGAPAASGSNRGDAFEGDDPPHDDDIPF